MEAAKRKNEEYELREAGYRQDLIRHNGEKVLEKGGVFGNGKTEAQSVDHNANLTF